jgi:small subunit ribosomal protein S8
MGMTDPIADMLTRIRNGIMAKKEQVDIPSSKLKVGIARMLKDEGYINNFKVVKDKKQGVLRVYLKYDSSGKGVIGGISRISKPSRRVYVRKDRIPRVLNGLGVAIISTSRGVITDREARKLEVGGEVVCSVW